ncbi:SRSF protein kinase-like protein [Hapsidospora chrysogenum ATCC 11550]|uniref:non-specific serine/threonine protein kinase n=1 Tax=Hapsidospora chrysogenum (strain ATCC 11550 / CBS 779.69 / DSM 880 / IAM 14645 / JCM 23072 / IMI 49137) TaxID=857340 RepID=A0A086T8K2_HAPC1|nr:SRSF protein kinase-like protein [Hapsidospora chrysogenum ATCC 11550]
MADDTSDSQLPQLVYVPEVDLEDFEDYAIGDTLQDGRYEVIHKLGYGGYSTIWLARDNRWQRYVSLKVLVASEGSKSAGADMIRRLHTGSDTTHPGQQLMPRLLDEFSFAGPNGTHVCLMQEPAGCSIAASKEKSVNFMFPVETARSIAAQLIMGLSYLHSRGICHGGRLHHPALSYTHCSRNPDLHLRNVLLHAPGLEKLSLDELYKLYPVYKAPITRMDGAPLGPHAPSYAVYPMNTKVAADKLVDPLIKICDYGTSFLPATEPSPTLHTPPLFLPPGDFFNEPITLAADIWPLGVSLYEVLGERALFEFFSDDRDDILADVISTLGMPPARWWSHWENRKDFFEKDGAWISNM